MFVRWKHRFVRRLKSWSPPNERANYAVLVESSRVNGKSRQRVVRHLGAIRDGDLIHPLTVERFWQDVGRVLDEMEILGESRQVIEARINETVPRPDPVVLERVRAEFDVWKAAMASMTADTNRRRFYTVTPV
jgi:hypothetical protein